MLSVEQTLESIVNDSWVEYGRCHGKLEGYHRRAVRGFPKHILFFIPTQVGIELVRVLHGSRDIEKWLR